MKECVTVCNCNTNSVRLRGTNRKGESERDGGAWLVGVVGNN